MNLKEEKISSKKIFDGKVIKVFLDEVKCPNGNVSQREIVKHNGGSCILGITNEGKVILEQQYRYAYDEVIYELPAGKLEPNEEPLEAAIREFEEETGYHPNSMKALGQIYPSAGYTNEVLYLYYTDDFYKTKTNLDEDEAIIIKEFSFAEILQMIKAGIIKDGKTICAIHNYLLYTNKLM